jgi:hypothetical protein
VNHQEALDKLVREITLSPLLEHNVDWYRENVRFLKHRMGRIKCVKCRLLKKETLTEKQRRFLNRYRAKLARVSGVHQHREYLLMIAERRLKHQFRQA